MLRPIRLGILALAASLLVFSAGGSRHVSAQGISGTLQSTTTGVLGPLPLHAGLTIIHGRNNGTSNWAADLISQDPTKVSVTQDPQNGFEDYQSLFNLIGTFNGSIAVMVPANDNYYIWVTLASGAYQFSVDQPIPETVTPVNQSSFSGKQQQVTPVFNMVAGTYTISASSTSTSLRVYMYEIDDLGGYVVQPVNGSDSPDGRVLDLNASSASTSGSVQVSLTDNSPYVIYVDAEGAGTANWTLSIN